VREEFRLLLGCLLQVLNYFVPVRLPRRGPKVTWDWREKQQRRSGVDVNSCSALRRRTETLQKVSANPSWA